MRVQRAREAVLVKVSSYGRKMRSEEETVILVFMMSFTFSREMILPEGKGEMLRVE